MTLPPSSLSRSPVGRLDLTPPTPAVSRLRRGAVGFLESFTMKEIVRMIIVALLCWLGLLLLIAIAVFGIWVLTKN